MALWLILMFAGLGALGFVFYKVWTSQESGIDKKFLGIALAGAVFSIVGLIMTLRAVQEDTQAFVPRATIGDQTATPLPMPPTGTNGATGNSTVPEAGVDEPETGGPSGGLPRFDPAAYPENPEGKPYTKEEVAAVLKQTTTMLDKIEATVSEDQTLQAQGETREARAVRWTTATQEVEHIGRFLRGKVAEKNGPGSGRIRQLTWKIAEDLILMQRMYHNYHVLAQEYDPQYISDLRAEIDRYSKELEKLGAQ